ncbi:MAG: DUF5335 family protein [Sandaracinaceae bacterium]
MATRRLDRDRWQGYFDALSKSLPTAKVEIGIVGDRIGDQREVDWAMWRGATYDRESDALDVFVGQLGHQIARPREIWVDDSAGLKAIEVIDGEGQKQIIRLRAPLQLPPDVT